MEEWAGLRWFGGFSETKWASLAQTQSQHQDPIFRRSKHIDVYSLRSRKWHFEHNGGGPESKFDRLRKNHIWDFKWRIKQCYIYVAYSNTLSYINAGCYRNIQT